MRKLIMLLAVSLAALVGASAAGANNFPIYQCPWTSSSLGTSYAGHAIYVYPTGGVRQPLRIHFGWAASSLKQVNAFLGVQSTADAGTIIDSSGNLVWSYESTPFTGWGIGNLNEWTAPVYTSGLQTPSGQPASGYVTIHNSADIPTLADGVYTLSLEWDISQRVLDGYQTAAAGAIYKTTNCTFTVQS